MRLLLVHNYYGSSAPSGENIVYEAERDLLRAHGHQVAEFTRTSDELNRNLFPGQLRAGLTAPWNPMALRAVRRAIEHERPDVMHVHNTYPLLSPAIFRAVRGTATATVVTLHNYRYFCASPVLMRQGQPCTLCLDRRSSMLAIRYGCYRGSRAATLPLAVMSALHRRLGTLTKDVDRVVALTSFQKNLLVRAGLAAEGIEVKPHFLAAPPGVRPWADREGEVLYLGRLGPEKGVRALVEAWAGWRDGAPRLDLIGNGPERGALEEAIGRERLGGRVGLQAALPFEAAQDRLANARLLVLPSVCFEGFPLVIREAYAHGVPVAASRLGALPELVREGEAGVLFEPGEPADIQRTVAAAWGNQALLAEMGRRARAEFEAKYTAEIAYRRLMEIYESAITTRRERGGARGR
jgi:glycosyltransferase involved in cell wall biosynthesis